MPLSLNGRVLVIGDRVVDVYHHGRVVKTAAEAPVPVFVTDRVEQREGGAANVTAQVRALGASVLGVYPSDADCCRKHRYVSGQSMLFRIDDDRAPPSRWMKPMKQYGAVIAAAGCVVLSDYAKGALTDDVLRFVIETAARYHVPVIVDPKRNDWSAYAGATHILPNTAELAAAENVPDIQIIEKCGARGIRWGPDLYPARAKQVFDVTGAGDVVVAVIGSMLAAGGYFLSTACQVASLAAGYAVGQMGTAICPLDELNRLMEG